MKKIYFLVLALCLFASANAQIINFPDANFKALLLIAGPSNGIAFDSNFNSIRVDTNFNNEIEVNEALAVYKLNTNLLNAPISDLTGLSYFSNLRYFDCSMGDHLFTTLDLSALVNLQYLNCYGNNLTDLNVTGLSNLEYLDCSVNDLSSLNVVGLTNLKVLRSNNNNLSNLDLSNLFTLEEVYVSANQLVSLNVTGDVNLLSLSCEENQLSSLDMTGLLNLLNLNVDNNLFENLNLEGLSTLISLSSVGNPLLSINLQVLPNLGELYLGGTSINEINFDGLLNLNVIWCNDNQLTTLDVSNLPNLYELHCNNNLLESLFIKNGRIINNAYFDFAGNPNLQYICADEAEINNVQNKIVQYDYVNCHVNSYCSFVPGGSYYTIQGNSKFDENNNGCDASDVALSNQKFNITNGSNTGSLIANTSGNYNIPVVEGTHVITPVFENPSYFTASPSTVNVTFPTQTSPFTQDFCITANGVHPDLEVSILPLSPARPGFDATYKLVYKNKGNTTQSGTINFVFNDAVLDLVSANPVVITQTVNNLSWDFTNLSPFESREIAFTLNVNSPMETPAVNGGDVLNYTATITSPAADDMPNDNTFVFNQTVVNSYDPNDKTCLEGATIPPSKVGDYVHYMIRFENNGTANAQNIVVKDMIDANKFDINSLVPIKGSHSFVTNISAGNKVEFIFENINLPFDDANNDGYVAFKIKTKPTLTNGDTFSNSASIYFDYNFPIVTNTATTTIQALSRLDFEFSNYFKLYPNPVSTTLNVDAKDAIQISSINIYNTLGQLVLVVPNAQDVKTIDVSNLSSGNYFIKINSDKGTSNTKFIKQ